VRQRSVLTTVYSIGYTRALREHAQTRYFASFALCLFATVDSLWPETS
jgi:multicomponent Na+:H+ antiporter subunit D